MSLPRYPEYKDSGVEWLGEVPAHWSITRVQDIAKVINGYPFDARLFEVDGAYPLIRIRDLDASEAATRYDGKFIQEAAITSADVLIGMDGDFNVGRWFGDSPALLNQRMCCIRTESQELSTLLRYALPAPLQAINDITYATTVKHLSSFQVQKLQIALPSNDSELSAIATFLDRETAKIDGLIAEQEKLIALLAEKRQATISHAVTKGLNPAAPMKDSGVAWLGEVPAHWNVGPLKRFADVIDCKHYTVEFLDEGLPIVSIRELAGDRINLENAKLTSQEAWEFLREGRVPVIGDMIFCRNASVGAVGYVETEQAFCMGQDVCLIRPKVKGKYAHYQLVAPETRSQIEALLVGATIRRANVEEIRNLLVASPPVQEQVDIVYFLSTETARLDALTAEATRAIALLKERRSALISAAVTGKIDVRQG